MKKDVARIPKTKPGSRGNIEPGFIQFGMTNSLVSDCVCAVLVSAGRDMI